MPKSLSLAMIGKMFTQNYSNAKQREMLPTWRKIADCYDGAIAVRGGDRRVDYLPPLESERLPTSGLTQQWKTRYALACYKNLFKPTIDDIVGLMQRNPAIIEFEVADESEMTPQEVKDIEIYGNDYNDGLVGIKRRLNLAQALFGRAGLLLEIETESTLPGQGGIKPRFVIKEYDAESILDGEVYTPISGEKARLKWVLLDESTSVFNSVEKKWEPLARYRILGVTNNAYYSCIIEGDDQACMQQWKEFDFDNPPPQSVYPVFRGATLPVVPFTVCNADRLGINQWQNPPFYDITESVLQRYQLSSIYHLGAYRHCSPTLVLNNAKPRGGKITLGGALEVESAGMHESSVQLLETTGNGLSELRAAMIEEESILKHVSLRDLLDGAGANSSGDAIELRTESGTAAIAKIDQAGALAIEEQLIFAAVWAGASWDEAGERITYKADTSYIGVKNNLTEVSQFLVANSTLGMLSKQNQYAIIEQAIPNTVSSWEDNEMQKINEGVEL